MPEAPVHKRGFLHEHSLSIASIAILLLWFVLYIVSIRPSMPAPFSGTPSRTGRAS